MTFLGLETRKLSTNIDWLLILFIIPVLCSLLLKPQPEQESFIMKHAHRLYLPFLEYAMDNKKVVLSTAGLFLLAD